MTRIRRVRRGAGGPKGPTLIDLPWQSGLSNLSADLTINGQTVSPSYQYFANDIVTASEWVPRIGSETLSVAGTGSDLTFNNGTPLLDSTVGAKTAYSGKYLQGAGSQAAIGTKDFVVELLLKPRTATAGIPTAALICGQGGGWSIRLGSGNTIQVYAYNGPSPYTTTPTQSAVTAYAWYHIIIFFDRSGSMLMYLNGQAASAGSMAQVTGNCENNYMFFSAVAPYYCDSTLAYWSQWEKQDWLDTHLQEDLAKQRFYALTGVKAARAKGGSVYPAACSRTTAAYSHKDSPVTGTRKYYLVGPHWPRTVSEYTELDEAVSWTSVVGVSDVAGVLTKTASTGWGNCSAWNSVAITGDGGFKFKSDDTSKELMCGLSTSPTGSSYTTVEFGVYLAAGNYGVVYENGFPKTVTIGAYSPNDTFSVEVENGTVLYKRNGVTFYTSLATATSPLYTHVALKTIGAAISGARLVSEDKNFKGYFCESSVENIALQSEDFSTTWSPVAASDTVSTNVATSPLTGLAVCDGLVGNASDGEAAHGVSQAVTAGSARTAFSVFAKSGAKSWLALSTSLANTSCYFNLTTGTVGTQGSAVISAGIIPVGGGWYRCHIFYNDVAGARTIYIQPADSDGDNIYTATGAVDLFVVGAQYETLPGTTAGVGASSYVATATGGVTRTADTLYYDALGANSGVGSKITLQTSMYTKNVDHTNISGCILCVLDSTTSSSGDMLQVGYVVGSLDTSRCRVIKGGTLAASANGSVDIFNGQVHTLRVTNKGTVLSQYIDGTLDGSDSNAAQPENLRYLYVGSLYVAGYSTNIPIGPITVWRK